MMSQDALHGMLAPAGEPTAPALVLPSVHRPRWIISPDAPGFGRVVAFAPPSSLRARMMMAGTTAWPAASRRLASCLSISKRLLAECAKALDIEEDHVALCVGTMNDQLKIIAMDVTDTAPCILKFAVGRAADATIHAELAGIRLAQADPWWYARVPTAVSAVEIAGRPGIKLARVRGRRLRPADLPRLLSCLQRPFESPCTTLRAWLTDYLPSRYPPVLQEAWDICDRAGTLDQPVALGMIHGDCATWNTNDEAGQMVFFDWEYATVAAPTILDTAYALSSNAYCIKKTIPKNRIMYDLGMLWYRARRSSC